MTDDMTLRLAEALACHDASCRPPSSGGTGGSSPSGRGGAYREQIRDVLGPSQYPRDGEKHQYGAGKHDAKLSLLGLPLTHGMEDDPPDSHQSERLKRDICTRIGTQLAGQLDISTIDSNDVTLWAEGDPNFGRSQGLRGEALRRVGQEMGLPIHEITIDKANKKAIVDGEEFPYEGTDPFLRLMTHEKAINPRDLINLNEGSPNIILDTFPLVRGGREEESRTVYNQKLLEVAKENGEAQAIIVRGLLKDWGSDWGSAEQHRLWDIAQEEFGGDSAPHTKRTDSDQLPQAWVNNARLVMRQMYTNTQKALKEAGAPETVTIARGMRVYNSEEQRHLLASDAVQGRSMASYSQSAFIARFVFASDNGIVVVSKVPRDRILSTAATGFGSLREAEVVVLGGTYPSKIVPAPTREDTQQYQNMLTAAADEPHTFKQVAVEDDSWTAYKLKRNKRSTDQSNEADFHFHEDETFACHSAACRPPTSGGTGGSSKAGAGNELLSRAQDTWRSTWIGSSGLEEEAAGIVAGMPPSPQGNLSRENYRDEAQALLNAVRHAPVEPVTYRSEPVGADGHSAYGRAEVGAIWDMPLRSATTSRSQAVEMYGSGTPYNRKDGQRTKLLTIEKAPYLQDPVQDEGIVSGRFAVTQVNSSGVTLRWQGFLDTVQASAFHFHEGETFACHSAACRPPTSGGTGGSGSGQSNSFDEVLRRLGDALDANPNQTSDLRERKPTPQPDPNWAQVLQQHPTLSRGLGVAMTAKEHEYMLDDANPNDSQVALIIGAIQRQRPPERGGIGVHWTTTRNEAAGYSAQAAAKTSELRVILHVQSPDASSVMRPNERKGLQVWNYQREQEVPLRPGTKLVVTSIEWAKGGVPVILKSDDGGGWKRVNTPGVTIVASGALVTHSGEHFHEGETFACHDASCRPPTSGGTGGSTPTGGTGFHPPNGANPEGRWAALADSKYYAGEEQNQQAYVDGWAKHVPKEPKIIVRVPFEAIENIAKEGLKTQQETGTSRGTFDPTLRDAIETRMFDAANTRPIYGYTLTTRRPSNGPTNYGEVALELKSSVLTRTTLTAGDTFGETVLVTGGPMAPIPVLDIPSASGKRLMAASAYRATPSANPSWFEAQVHGKVTAADIARIHTRNADIVESLKKAFPNTEVVLHTDFDFAAETTDGFHFHEGETFACHSAACRPPTSGGTGGSSPRGPIEIGGNEEQINTAMGANEWHSRTEWLGRDGKVIADHPGGRMEPGETKVQYRINSSPAGALPMREIIRATNTRGMTADEIPKWPGEQRFMETVETIGPAEYVYRVVSENDYQRMSKQGFLDTDGRGNIGADEGLVGTTGRIAWSYLGDISGSKGSDNPTGTGRAIRIKLNPADGWHNGTDGYVKTNSRVPFTAVDMVTKPIGVERIITDAASGSFNTKMVWPPKTNSSLAGSAHFHDGATFACHDSSCRPPTSGGTGGSVSGSKTPKPPALSLEATISVAEQAMERGGDSGNTIHMPVGRNDDPEYAAAIAPIQEWAQDVFRQATGESRFIRIFASDYTLDQSGGGQAMVTGMGSIVTRPVTNEMTVLHEIAHLINRTHEGSGHDAEFAQLAHSLYAKHISPRAAQTFWDIVGSHADATSSTASAVTEQTNVNTIEFGATHFHEGESFACHSAACRPPTSGGTGGSTPANTAGTAPDTNYRGLHQPNPEGPRAFNILENEVVPKDIYDNPQYYTGYDGLALHQTMKQLRDARGKPTATITIYRAAPKNETIENGDWVTLSKKYAEQHAQTQSRDNSQLVVHQSKVPATDVRWAIDDLAEWGYFPNERGTEPPNAATAATKTFSATSDPYFKTQVRNHHQA